MADNNKLVGRDYQTPDLVAKVTGKARFAEDFKAEGMLFAKLLLSPMPHAKITRIDASAALASPTPAVSRYAGPPLALTRHRSSSHANTRSSP